MPRYLLSVFGPAERAEFGGYPSREAMLQAFADTGAFNERLQRERPPRLRRRPRARDDRDHRRRAGREAGLHRRALPRDEGAPRRLLGHRGGRPRRRPGACRRRVEGVPRRGGGASLPHRGVRRGHAGAVTGPTVEQAITRVHHEEWARVVAGLARRFGDLDIAEEAAAEAFAAAAERWPRDGCAAQSRRLARHHRDPQGDRPAPSRVPARRQAPGGPDGARRHPSRADRSGRGRPAPARLHLLPPCARDGGPGGAHPAPARRAHRRRDRPRLPRAGDHDGAADHPRQGQDQGGTHPLPRALGRRHPRAARRRARRRLPRLQRGLPRRCGGRPGARRPHRRGDPPRPPAPRPRAGRRRGGRPAGPDAAHRRPATGARVTHRGAGDPRRAGPRRVGPRR